MIAPVSPFSSATRPRRITPIDATRGLAMLFSCISHFGWWIHSTYPFAGSRLSEIGMVATPTFLFISGAMVGMLCADSVQSQDRLKSQLFNRGLFLLTIGHVLIALAESGQTGGIINGIRGASIVDEIGLCTLSAAFFIPRIADPIFCRRIAAFAAGLFILCWCVAIFWQPDEIHWQIFKQVLLGGTTVADTQNRYVAPTIQYVAIYAMGLPIGHALAGYLQQSVRPQRIAKLFLASGALLFSVACILRVIGFVTDASGFGTIVNGTNVLHQTLAVTQKIPPSPAYLMFFGGAGLAFAGGLFWLFEQSPFAKSRIIPWLAVIGQASLFVFILQYFLYWTIPYLLGLTPNRWSIVLFVCNILIVRYSAGIWTRIRGNRWMTFGFQLQTKGVARQIDA